MTNTENETQGLAEYVDSLITHQAKEDSSANPLIQVLDENNIDYSIKKKWIILNLVNESAMKVNMDTGDHVFSTDPSKTYKQTRKTVNGWKDFLALKKVIHWEKAASCDLAEMIMDAEQDVQMVAEVLDQLKIRYKLDQLTDFFLIDCRQKKLKHLTKCFINVRNGFVQVNDRKYNFTSENLIQIFEILIGKKKTVDKK